jgi:hypothetical protein
VDEQRTTRTDLMLIDVSPVLHLRDAVALTATVEGVPRSPNPRPLA